MKIRLPAADGAPQDYALRAPGAFARPARPFNRVAYAAAHVVADPLSAKDPWLEAAIDWEATLAYRRHLWSWGFGVAEAMEDAPRAAVNAAIEMRRRVREYNKSVDVPIALDVHSGINVGLGIAGEAAGSLLTHAGPEIGVASTKAFTSQLVVLSLLTLLVAQRKGHNGPLARTIVSELVSLPEKVKTILAQSDTIKEIAAQYHDSRNFLYLGRGFNFPVALEGALKLKEISSREGRRGQASSLSSRLMAHVPFGLSVTNPDGTLEYVNPAFTALFGYDRADLPDRATWFEKAFPDPSERGAMERSYKEDATASLETLSSRPRTMMIRTRDGRRLVCEARVQVLPTGEHLVVFEDMTDRSRVEAERVNTGKMEAMGNLAGTIAHTVNNILMGIQGYTSLMLMKKNPDDPDLIATCLRVHTNGGIHR